MSAMGNLHKAADSYAHEKIDEFLRALSADTLAVMMVDYETGHDAPQYDPRYRQILDAGFRKVPGGEFVNLVNKVRAQQAPTPAGE